MAQQAVYGSQRHQVHCKRVADPPQEHQVSYDQQRTKFCMKLGDVDNIEQIQRVLYIFELIIQSHQKYVILLFI